MDPERQDPLHHRRRRAASAWPSPCARRATAPTSSIAAKTTEPNPKLPGTIHSAAEEIEAAGGKALPLQADIRDEASVLAAVAQAVEQLRRHRHPRQQRQRDQPDADAGHADEALRPDVRRQRARHLPVHAGLPAAADRIGAGRPQSARADDVAAAVDEAALVRAPRGLHDGQVRHEHVHARPRRRIRSRTASRVNSLWPRTAIATAALQMIPGRRPRALPHAGDPGRRRLPDPDQRREDDHRQLLHRRQAARRARRHRSRSLQRDAGNHRFHPGFLRRLNRVASSQPRQTWAPIFFSASS